MTTADDRIARLERAIRQKRASAEAPGRLASRPPDQPAALGEMQTGLWFLHQLEPLSPAYNLCSAFRVEGSIDREELARALNEVVARHRILRSTYRHTADAVLQVVHPHSQLAIESLEAARGQALEVATRAARRPFDLATGPLVRMHFVEERPAGTSLLLLVAHHILLDEQSLSIFWRELAEAYQGRSPAEQPIPQYDDYVYWANRRDPDRRRDEIEFWRRRLDPMPEELRLPFERDRTAVPAGEDPSEPRGRLLRRELPGSDQRDIRRLAAAAGVSPFTVYAFAYRLLLERYAPGTRLAFATPATTRSSTELAETLGYFLNPVVITARIDGRESVEACLRDFGRHLRESLGHASVPFQTLTEELAPTRQPHRDPIFQTMFVYQQTGPPPDLGQARLEPVVLDLGESKFDLTFFATERQGSLEIAVEYRTDRFAEARMEGLLGHYANLARGLAADPGRAADDVSLLTPEEERRLTEAGRGADLANAGTSLLPRAILDQCRKTPDATSLVCGGSSLSYAELSVAARRIARDLLFAGVQAGDRVGLFFERSTTMIEAIFGIHLAGAAYVPLDSGYPEARHRVVLEDAEVVAVLTSPGLRDRLPEGPWPVLEPRASGDPAGTEELPDPSPEAPAYLLYTSGSTGRPKGVVVSHENLRASNRARSEAYDLHPGRFLLLPSIAFDSSVAGIFWTLATGGTLVIATDDEVLDPAALASRIDQSEVGSLLCVPSLYARILDEDPDRLRGLEAVIVAGESCPPRLVGDHFEALPHVRLFNEYGPTEATVWATVHEMTPGDAEGPVPIGRPVPGARIDLLDASGRRVPAGVPGQAWIRGRTVADGYWRRPDLTGESFTGTPGTDERSFRTGDLMVWTEDDRLLFLGRRDEQIKLRGFRIEPGEIEEALTSLPGIELAAVVARSSARSGPEVAADDSRRLVAFVQGPGAGDSWRQELARRLPGHMIPSRVVELPALPLSPNGKIDRRRLREMPLDPEPPAEPSDHVPGGRELSLISLWEGLLGSTGIRASDNFFELGGHSLLVVEMVRAIERDFEVRLSPADVFEHPTVEQLAEMIGSRERPTATPYHHLYPIQPRGRGAPLVFAIPHFFTAMLAERFRGERPVYGLRGVGLRAEGNLGRWRTMRDLGEELVLEIQRRFPGESLLVAGYSFGASMAVETVRLLEERKIPVERLYLVAPMPLDVYRLGPFRLQLDGLRKPVSELSPKEALSHYLRENNPLTLRPYRRAWRRLAVESWRRLLCRVGRLRLRAGLPLTPAILWADVRVDRFRLHARYRPGSIRTPTVIFNAREPATDAAATWRPHFEGPLTIHQIPDPHLDESSIAEAKRAILHHLEELGDV